LAHDLGQPCPFLLSRTCGKATRCRPSPGCRRTPASWFRARAGSRITTASRRRSSARPRANARSGYGDDYRAPQLRVVWFQCARAYRQFWHTDGLSQLKTPPAVGVMYCLDATTRGGETRFVDGHRTFERLPPEQKARCLRMQVQYASTQVGVCPNIPRLALDIVMEHTVHSCCARSGGAGAFETPAPSRGGKARS
jgi:hypothetical protein